MISIGQNSSLQIKGNNSVFTFDELRFELSNTETKELYEDFRVTNIVYNQSITQNDASNFFKVKGGHSIDMGQLEIVTKTGYFHDDRAIWAFKQQLQDFVNSIDSMINDKHFKMLNGLFFWK